MIAPHPRARGLVIPRGPAQEHACRLSFIAIDDAMPLWAKELQGARAADQEETPCRTPGKASLR